MTREFLDRFYPRVLTLKEYNESRTTFGILTGKEYRRQRRKERRK